jgi:hypothetical protein
VLLSGNITRSLRYRAVIALLDTPSQHGGDTRVRFLGYAGAEVLAT